MGGSTVAAIVGQRLAPGFLDRYLGKTGYRSQQYDGPENPNKPNNLWESVPGNFAAHGAFDNRAGRSSPELWLEMHRPWLLLSGAAFATGIIYELVFGRRNRRRNLKSSLKLAAGVRPRF